MAVTPRELQLSTSVKPVHLESKQHTFKWESRITIGSTAIFVTSATARLAITVTGTTWKTTLDIQEHLDVWLKAAEMSLLWSTQLSWKTVTGRGKSGGLAISWQPIMNCSAEMALGLPQETTNDATWARSSPMRSSHPLPLAMKSLMQSSTCSSTPSSFTVKRSPTSSLFRCSSPSLRMQISFSRMLLNNWLFYQKSNGITQNILIRSSWRHTQLLSVDRAPKVSHKIY